MLFVIALLGRYVKVYLHRPFALLIRAAENTEVIYFIVFR